MNISEQILYEDNHLLVLNKLSGQIVQADQTNDIPVTEDIKEYLKEKHQKEGNVFLGIPHRIDRPTTGIVVFAKTSKALYRMVDLFRNREVTKNYWAIVKQKPEEQSAKLVHYLRKNSKNNKSTVFKEETNDTKKAILSYEIIQELDNYFVLKVDLETGRHHQIRAQLAYIKSPIKGDVKYNFDRPNEDRSVCLHARSISFVHPIKKTKLYIEANVYSPEVIWKSVEGSQDFLIQESEI